MSTAATADRAVTLPDGRTLAFAEWGPADGPVVVLCHPATRNAVGWDVAAEAGVRIVFPDLPGMGRSSFKPDRAILEWPADVSELMTRLEVDQFCVAGVSAATPYALACGVMLGDRVRTVGVLAGTVPQPEGERTGVAALAVEDPEAAFAAIRAERTDSVDHEAGARRASERPEPDGALYSRPEIQAALIAASEETYRQGVDGPSWDSVLRIRRWGFELRDLVVPCRWWHGEDDPVVPLKLIEQATAALSQHTLRVVPRAGHGVCITHVAEFLGGLLA